MPQHHKKHGGERKYGRALTKCGVYRMLRKRERSHVSRLLRHIKRCKDTSPMAKDALERYQALIISR